MADPEVMYRLTVIEAQVRQIGLVLADLLSLLQSVQQQEVVMAADLKSLEKQITENTNAEQSAVALLNGLSDQLRQHMNDPIQIQKLADQLKQSSDKLAAAVVANTPAEGAGTTQQETVPNKQQRNETTNPQTTNPVSDQSPPPEQKQPDAVEASPAERSRAKKQTKSEE
jgi:hypothetical protein